jgi:Electron transfer DM13/Bacterial Ig-like domain (group 2)
MNMKRTLQTGGLALMLLSACVKTEIVPEQIEPKLNITAPNSTTLMQGGTLDLAAVYTDQEGRDRSNDIQWLSRNTAVASVSGAGLVQSVNVGQSWIVARAAGISDSVLITVIADLSQPASVVITSAAPTELTPGQNWPLSAQVLNGNNVVIAGAPIAWQSSNDAIATVGSDGVLLAVSAGSVQITAKSGSLTSLPMNLNISAPNQARSGNFAGNGGYSVSGTATLTAEGGNLSLQLGSNFQASNGPMLGVFLAKNASGALTTTNSLKLGDLSSNSGAQTYAVPAGVAINDYNYVVIYCIPFNVRFGTALLN